MSVLLRVALTLALLVFVSAQPAFAQATPPGRVSGAVGGLFGDGGLAPEVAASAGYRFSEVLGIEFEFSYLPGLDFEELEVPLALPTGVVLSSIPGFDLEAIGRLGLVAPFPYTFKTTGRAAAFVSNFVAEFQATNRLRPYVLAGGGVGHVMRKIEIEIDIPVLPPGLFVPLSSRSFVSRVGDTALALSLGGGLDFLAWKNVGIGGDVRYLHLFGEQNDYDMLRAGTRVSFRF